MFPAAHMSEIEVPDIVRHRVEAISTRSHVGMDERDR